MTDKQKEQLFESIEDFDQFLMKIGFREDIRISEKVEIKFINGSVLVIISNTSIKLSIKEFNFLINELREQDKIKLENQKFYEQKDLKEKRLNELTYLGNNTYKVEKEFYENMVFARDIASAQGTYKRKIGIIAKTLRKDGKIILNDKTISSLSELENEIKHWYGFKSLQDELKK